jgi:peroxiredoxin
MTVRSLVSVLVGGVISALLTSTLPAQELTGFGPMPRRGITVPDFSDQQVTDLVGRLDDLLLRHSDPPRRTFDVESYVKDFTERLQFGTLNPAQEARVLDHFAALATRYPADAPILDRAQRIIRRLSVGKVAPEITGRDLDGLAFKLSDYRGRVVVLTFSGEWCAACRGDYPFQRLLLELYKDRPFVLLGVNSDRDPRSAKQSKMDHGLTYRTWWDGGGSKNTEGPIAKAWAVSGWPTIYVLDERGVIRFANLRQEDLLIGVRQLMDGLHRPVAVQ